MNLIALILILLLLFGGGIYYGGPYIDGVVGSVLIVALILVVTARL